LPLGVYIFRRHIDKCCKHSYKQDEIDKRHTCIYKYLPNAVSRIATVHLFVNIEAVRLVSRVNRKSELAKDHGFDDLNKTTHVRNC